MNSADQKLRQSPLWKSVVKAYAKLAAAQRARDADAWTKAWREFSEIVERNELPLPDYSLREPSRIVQELEAAFAPNGRL